MRRKHLAKGERKVGREGFSMKIIIKLTPEKYKEPVRITKMKRSQEYIRNHRCTFIEDRKKKN